MQRERELTKAVERLILAAQRRENVLGDPSSLIAAKAELADAAVHARNLIGDSRDKAIQDAIVVIQKLASAIVEMDQGTGEALQVSTEIGLETGYALWDLTDEETVREMLLGEQ